MTTWAPRIQTHGQKLHKNSLYQTMQEKLFSPPATAASVERIFSHSGLLMRPNRARMGDTLLSQLVFLRCNNQCSLMFFMPIVCLYADCVDTDSCCVWRLWSPCHTYMLSTCLALNTRSSATAEKQRVSCACLPRLDNWSCNAQNTAES